MIRWILIIAASIVAGLITAGLTARGMIALGVAAETGLPLTGLLAGFVMGLTGSFVWSATK